MTITITNLTDKYVRQQREIDHLATKRKTTNVTLTMDNSYTTGGLSLTATMINHGFKEIVSVIPSVSTNGYIPVFDSDNNKLKVLETNSDYAGNTPLVEVANGSDLSTVSFNCWIVGY